MNRLNPLYILLLCVMIALFSAYSASKKEQELEELQREYRVKEDLALRLSALKKAYSPKRKREIERVLHSSVVRKSGIQYEDKRDRLHISGKNVDIQAANMLTSKLLNGTFNIKKFSINKAKEGVDLEMEIGWR